MHVVGESRKSCSLLISLLSSVVVTETLLALTMIGAGRHVGVATRDVHDGPSNQRAPSEVG